MDYLKQELRDCKYIFVAFAAVIIVTLALTETASADYAYLAVDKNDYIGGTNWQDTVTGYDMQDEAKGLGYTIGYVWEKKHHNIRLSITDHGQVSRNAFWSGSFDDDKCKTCGPVVDSYQVAEAQSLALVVQPKINFSKGDIHFTVGPVLYNSTWMNREFQAADKNKDVRTWTSTQTSHASAVTALAGVGFTYRRLIVDFEMALITTDSETSHLGGAGAYDGIKKLSIGVKF